MKKIGMLVEQQEKERSLAFLQKDDAHPELRYMERRLDKWKIGGRVHPEWTVRDVEVVECLLREKK